MRSIKFPNMFSKNSTNVWKTSEYKSATYQNTELLLNSMRGELIGDPYFGTLLYQYLYDQNSAKLKDVIIDLIYNQLAIFIPQVKIKRTDIEIIPSTKKALLIVRFSGINQIDYQLDTYNLTLFSDTEQVTQ